MNMIQNMTNPMQMCFGTLQTGLSTEQASKNYKYKINDKQLVTTENVKP